MALKKSELYSSIWQACDQLRGGMEFGHLSKMNVRNFIFLGFWLL